jgi:UDP-N-acetylmuramate--alanine ligase
MGEMDGRTLHFIAIGGAGMSGLALICSRLGATVTGSDRSESTYMQRLRQAGLDPRVGHDAELVPEDAEIVISTAIPDDNPELVRARERGQREMHRGELLAELCGLKKLIAVAGTHGKTTTSGMLVHGLRTIGVDPAFALGGELPGAGADGAAANAGWGDGEWIIAEADESDGSFLSLRPSVAVITNVELDHHSRWSGKAELLEAFARFAADADGTAIGSDVELEPAGKAIRFDAETPPGELELSVPGAHNVLNARAALAAVELAGLDGPAFARSLSGFPGMLRRQQLKGQRNGAAIYDDYAHHPTEVRATLQALRELRPKRLIAVFQPHLYSRTKALGEQFGAALAAADEIALLEIYPAREKPEGPLEGVSAVSVARAAADHAGGKPVWWLVDRERAAAALGPRLGPGDLLVTIGAGDVFRLAENLVEADGAGGGR